MKDISQGLASEDIIEATILCSDQFRSILKKYCDIDANVEGNNQYAVFKSLSSIDKNNAIKLMKDIREGRLKDDARGVINLV